MVENDPQSEATIEADALATIPSPSEATSKLTEVEDEENVFVAASTLEEMNVAQQKLIIWAGKKIEKLKDEFHAAEVNLGIAKKRKWATEPFKRTVALATKKVEFYEKVRAALEDGYTIIPDMPMDIFAIRTTAKKPRKNLNTGTTQYGGHAFIQDQESNSPALGEGRYVSPRAFTDATPFERKEKDGSIKMMENRWASEFDEAIDFPFKMAKPSVLNAAAKALSKRLFDEIGGAPSRQQSRRGDPMVIGRIFYGSRFNQKSISFLVSWFIDSKDL